MLLFSIIYEKIIIVKDSGIMANIKTMTVTVDFYKQFEELSNKLDDLIKENKNINTTHKNEIKKLKQDLKKEFKQEKEELKTTITNLEKSSIVDTTFYTLFFS